MRVKHYESLSSTNNYAKELINQLNHFDVVTAKRQTSGKGRNNNTWMSSGDNLYLSIVLKEDISHQGIFKEVMVASISVIKTLELYNLKPLIKYPNDILINNKKISGILIESSGSIVLHYLVVGVGLNINQIDFNELSDKAVSMKQLTTKRLNVEDVLSNFLETYQYYRAVDSSKLLTLYKEKSLIYNRDIKVDGKLYNVLDIKLNGDIVLKDGNDIFERNFNEISLSDIY
ncbi:MAG: biotin--[acetyl-CoA-carboxylase] ligase [Candidatus Izemoplasma sp.]